MTTETERAIAYLADFGIEAEPVIEVQELGEDGDAFMVVGTNPNTDPQLIQREIAKHLIDSWGLCGETIEKMFLLPRARMEYRTDWVRRPTGDDEYILYSTPAALKPAGSGQEEFAGTAVRV